MMHPAENNVPRLPEPSPEHVRELLAGPRPAPFVMDPEVEPIWGDDAPPTAVDMPCEDCEQGLSSCCVPPVGPDLRRRLNEALDWNANLVRRVEPIVAGALREAGARRRRVRYCGCAWCCANTPPDQRGEVHRRTCRP